MVVQPCKVVRVTAEMREAAAARLVGDRAAAEGGVSARGSAGRRFLASAAAMGINLDLMWATVGPETDASGNPELTEVCLAVPAAGRTANIFVSAFPRRSRRGLRPPVVVPVGAGHADRVALIQEACRFLAEPGTLTGRGVALAQALLEEGEQAAAAAMASAGFLRLGELSYLRRPMPRRNQVEAVEMPEGMSAVSIARGASESDLVTALDGSYEGTLDCPELSGLRETQDVLASHRAVGRFDPNLWWVLYEDGASGDRRPVGCLLLNPSPEQESVELVYLGLAPAARGRGAGRALLSMGLCAIAGRSERWVTCAVDTRNPPALGLYRRAGFERFSSRVPLVRRLGA